jgi:hypothetical protein
MGVGGSLGPWEAPKPAPRRPGPKIRTVKGPQEGPVIVAKPPRALARAALLQRPCTAKALPNLPRDAIHKGLILNS